MWGNMMGGYGGYGGYGGGGFGALPMLLFWLLIAVGIVMLARWFFSAGSAQLHGPAPEDSALALLRERYARGEIDKAEFEARKKDL